MLLWWIHFNVCLFVPSNIHFVICSWYIVMCNLHDMSLVTWWAEIYACYSCDTIHRWFIMPRHGGRGIKRYRDPSICLSQPVPTVVCRTLVWHTGIIWSNCGKDELADQQKCADPRMDIDPSQVKLPLEGGISSRCPWGDNLLLLWSTLFIFVYWPSFPKLLLVGPDVWTRYPAGGMHWKEKW